MMDTDMSTTGPPPPSELPLRRPRQGRVVAGVAAGLAHRLGVPDWVVRLAFVAFAFAGGFGLALYLAGWLLIPEEGHDRPIAADLFGRMDSAGAWIGVALIAVAVIVVADRIAFVRGDLMAAAVLIVVGVLLYRGDLGRRGSASTPTEAAAAADVPTRSEADVTTPPPPPPPAPAAGRPLPPRTPPPPPSPLGRLTLGLAILAVGVMALVEYLSPDFDPSGRHYLGLVVGVIGLGLLVGTFFGRARWLIVVGALLLPLLLLSPFADLDLPMSAGDRVHRPQAVAAVEPEYGLGVGQLVIDLTEVPFAGETVTIEAELGLGQVVVELPPDVAVEATGRAGIGSVVVLGAQSAGMGAEVDRAREGTAGTVVVDARVNMGEVRIGSGGGFTEFDGFGGLGFGDHEITLTDPADLQPSYDLGSGDLVLDLSRLEIQAERRVEVSVGTGNLTVVLPSGSTTRVDARVGTGLLDMLGDAQTGVDLADERTVGEDNVLLTLSLHVGAGELIVQEGGMR